MILQYYTQLVAVMRTNIEIDDELMNEVMERTGLPTKKAAVEKGLRLIIQLANQKAVLDLRGKIDWVGDLDALRENRPFDMPPFVDDDDEAK
jgi:Arc/MetJ family transcription regulator